MIFFTCFSLFTVFPSISLWCIARFLSHLILGLGVGCKQKKGQRKTTWLSLSFLSFLFYFLFIPLSFSFLPLLLLLLFFSFFFSYFAIWPSKEFLWEHNHWKWVHAEPDYHAHCGHSVNITIKTGRWSSSIEAGEKSLIHGFSREESIGQTEWNFHSEFGW